MVSRYNILALRLSRAAAVCSTDSRVLSPVFFPLGTSQRTYRGMEWNRTGVYWEQESLWEFSGEAIYTRDRERGGNRGATCPIPESTPSFLEEYACCLFFSLEGAWRSPSVNLVVNSRTQVEDAHV